MGSFSTAIHYGSVNVDELVEKYQLGWTVHEQQFAFFEMNWTNTNEKNTNTNTNYKDAYEFVVVHLGILFWILTNFHICKLYTTNAPYNLFNQSFGI